MVDALELLFRPIASTLLLLARTLLWLAWDLCIETLGWTIGWLVCRVVSVAKFPRVRLTELEAASGVVVFVVDAVGLLVLAALVWLLTTHLGA